MQVKKISFGLRRDIPSNVEESRIIGFILSTCKKDRHGTILNQNNWKLDAFRLNPTVGYAHNLSGGLLTDPNPDYVIGKDLKPQVEGTGTDRKLTGLLQFEPASINPLAEKIFRKVLFGSLNTSSVGFLEIGQGKYGSGEEGLGRSQETYYFEGQELLEWSIVNIPSNPDAGKRKARTLEGEPIRTTCYVIQQLADRFRPSYLEKLPIDDIMVLLEAKDLNIKETDLGKVRKLLADPKAVADRIEMERMAFRKAYPKPAKSEVNKIDRENNFNTIKIHNMKKKVYLIDLISKSIKKDEYTEDELVLLSAGKEARHASGYAHLDNAPGLLSIPIGPIEPQLEEELPKQKTNKRDILTQAYLIGRKQNYLINPIKDESVFVKAGALYLQLGMNDVQVPSLSGILASWADDETDPDSDGDEITIGGATFSNKRLYVCLDIPEKLIRQGGPEADAWLKDNITAALAAKIDATLGGVLSSGTARPQGMGYKITSGFTTKSAAVVPAYSDLIAMEEAVGNIKAPIENFSFITNPAGRGIIRTLQNPADGSYIFDFRQLLDYPLYVSKEISSEAGSDGLGNLLLFGNWKDLGIVQFGAYDILVDPYTLKNKGKIQLTVNAYFDMKGLRGSSPTSVDESTEDDQYAYSFSSLAIK